MADLKFLRCMLFSGVSALPMLGGLGCTHFGYEIGYTGRRVADHTGLDDWEYYHSPKSGEIVRKHHRDGCGPWCEPAYYGYEPTCLSQWPPGYMGCPPMLEHVEVIAPESSSPIPPAPPAEAAPAEAAPAQAAPAEAAPAEAGPAEAAPAEPIPPKPASEQPAQDKTTKITPQPRPNAPTSKAAVTEQPAAAQKSDAAAPATQRSGSPDMAHRVNPLQQRLASIRPPAVLAVFKPRAAAAPQSEPAAHPQTTSNPAAQVPEQTVGLASIQDTGNPALSAPRIVRRDQSFSNGEPASGMNQGAVKMESWLGADSAADAVPMCRWLEAESRSESR